VQRYISSCSMKRQYSIFRPVPRRDSIVYFVLFHEETVLHISPSSMKR